MKKVYGFITKIMQKISTAGLFLSALTLFLIVSLIAIDVICRYILNRPISGQQELAELSIVVVVYFGLPYATRIRSHVRVEPITSKLPLSARNILYGILDFIIVIFMAILTYKVFKQAMFLTTTPGNATLILRIPFYWIYFITSVGAAISCLEFLMDGIRFFLEGIQAASKNTDMIEKGGEA